MNERSEKDDVAFRIQERMLQEARQSLADAREELAEAQAVRKERDTLREDMDNAWRQVSLDQVTITDLKEHLAITNKQLIEQRVLVGRLQQRVTNINNEYHNAYGAPITEIEARRSFVYDPDDFKDKLNLPIPAVKIAPDTKIEIKNDDNS